VLIKLISYLYSLKDVFRLFYKNLYNKVIKKILLFFYSFSFIYFIIILSKLLSIYIIFLIRTLRTLIFYHIDQIIYLTYTLRH
jgi:hypothetical protein